MATEDVDYYALLGIEATATSAEIRKAYRQKSLKVHPDRNPDDPQAAALFHELSIAADVLSDPTQRASFDALLTARNARKARFAALDNKRKALAEDLEAREREFKKQKAGEATEAQRKRQELERLKEEGRRLREMKMNEANAGEQARQQEEAERDERRRAREGGAAAANGGGPAGVVELGPLDKTLKVKWQRSVHPSLGSVEALTTFFRTALAPHDPDLDSVVLSSKTLAQPSKGKFGSGVVAFRSLKAAVRAVKGKAADPDGMWRGFEVDWAAGQPPAALGGASTNPAPPVAAASPAPQPIPKTTPVSANEDAVLAKLRQRERERERLMEEMRRQDEEEEPHPLTMATEPASSPPPPPPPHPYLTKSELYISGLPSAVRDTEIVHVLRDCLRVRLHLERDPKDGKSLLSMQLEVYFSQSPAQRADGFGRGLAGTAPLLGKIEFESLDRAEKAYATCNNARVGAHPGSLQLSIIPGSDASLDPVPTAQCLIVKHLPQRFTPSELYDLARPFGAVHSIQLLFTPHPSSGLPTFTGRALVIYYEEEHAAEARIGLHFLEVKGQNIAVQVYDPKRGGGGAKGSMRRGNSPLQSQSPPSSGSAPRTTSPTEFWRPSSSPETPSPLERKSAALLGLGLSSPASASGSQISVRPVQPPSTSKSKWADDGGAASSRGAAKSGISSGDDGSSPAAARTLLEKLSLGTPQATGTSDRSLESSRHARSAASQPQERPKSERERLADQVTVLVPDAATRDKVLALLYELPKRDRAMCLFNSDFLLSKVQDALVIVGTEEEEEKGGGDECLVPKTGPGEEIATAATLPGRLVDLATWSSSRIVPLLPALIKRFDLAVPATGDVTETRTFMGTLEGKPASEVKQKLGERLFRVVKAIGREEGLKGAARITIELLDAEDDLGALAELMHYPGVLREKVIVTAQQLAAKGG
ncbi:hypothetical protein B0A53_05843 [Rhodotorula sp. CCFEE 5036]|nr:hypothetical protein B0A53_05843 [Rhodotorula sp. CCFEE 5036]